MTTSTWPPPVSNRIHPESSSSHRHGIDQSGDDRLVRDGVLVLIGGQLERVLGLVTSLMIRSGLGPSEMGLYTGLRLALDQTNRSSLGIGQGAVQEIPILRASGRHDEAAFDADVALTALMLMSLLYASGLITWATAIFIRSPDNSSRAWAFGLLAIATLVPLRRYHDFLIAVHRAHQRFALLTRMQVWDTLVFAILVGLGLTVAGLWGLIGAVGGLMVFNVAYLHARSPLRFAWQPDLAASIRMARAGLPIWIHTLLFGLTLGVDRYVILGVLPNGTEVAGLYSVAILGTSWAQDVTGRLATVLYPALQATIGRTGDRRESAQRALQATEAQVVPLIVCGSWAYFLGPPILTWLLPSYRDGLSALGPLLPGTILIGLSWPARQALTAAGNSVSLAVANGFGLALTGIATLLGAQAAGLVGVAWGMSIGLTGLALATTALAFGPRLGWGTWCIRMARILGFTLAFGIAALIAIDHLKVFGLEGDWGLRVLLLSTLTIPTVLWWLWKHRDVLDGLRGRARGSGGPRA